jgi:hypothetical protein
MRQNSMSFFMGSDDDSSLTNGVSFSSLIQYSVILITEVAWSFCSLGRQVAAKGRSRD